MKYLLLLFITLPLISFSQTNKNSEKKVNPLALYTNPEFIGGQKALNSYINEHFNTPKTSTFKGEIIVKFFINENGEVKTPSVLKGLSKQLDKKALKIIAEMPNWNPGTQNGKTVKVMYAYTFKIK